MTTFAAAWTQPPQPCASVSLKLNTPAQKGVALAFGPFELLLILIPLAINIGIVYLIVQVARNSKDIKHNAQDIAQLREAQKNGPSAEQGPLS